MAKTISEEIVKEAEEKITVEDYDDLDGEIIVALLDNWCAMKDVNHLYIKKSGNHLEIGKAEIHCIE